MRNRKKLSVVSCQSSVAATRYRTDHGRRTTDHERRSNGSSRRGVLLLVVLSMLVLFMLIGTAFLMTSNQARTAAKASGKKDSLGNLATENLNRAALQLLRDTDNQYSVIRYHGLLRDEYGTDGFQGVINNPGTRDLTTAEGQVTRFAGAPTDTPAQQLGSTNGQFIDIYVSAKPYAAVDYSTLYNATTNPLDLRNVLKLDRNPYGQPQPYPLPLTKGYFNGCLLTVTSGAAAGQSTRILDYEYIGDTVKATTPPTRFFRFRVMSVQSKDGQSLQVDQTTGAQGRMPELKDLTGQTFIVNGRAFSGTGVGYNPLAATGQPRLNALQLLPIDSNGGFKSFTIGTAGNYVGAEIALLPNSVYFNPLSTTIAIGAAPSTITDPFGPIPNTVLLPLNTPTAKTPVFNYPTYVGPGGANEGYDAADFQNLFMALQTVTPRPQGRVVHKNGSNPPVTLDVSDPLVLSDTANFLRLDLEDVPLPSFHRPDLVNFWNHRLVSYLGLQKMKTDDAVRAVVQPYSDDPTLPLWTVNPNAKGLTPELAALISAIKRQVSLRPTREDNPHFDGSNQDSIPADLSGLTLSNPGDSIAIPIWDVVGRWDVDNDNDGVRDSVWLDLGDPIQETEDGRRYKAVYAILCVDLDSRLNVNAHGLADDLVPPLLDATRNKFFDPTYDPTKPANWVGNLVHNSSSGNAANGALASTLQLSRGIGYGPADISLRPVFPAPLDVAPSYNPIFKGNRSETAGPVDSYAAVLSGRLSLDGKEINGRHGFDINATAEAAMAGTNYRFDLIDTTKEKASSPRWYTGEQATPNLAAQMKFFNYPWSFWNAASGNTQRNYQSAFGTMPDLKGRYATGLDYSGQPVYEAAYDLNPNTALMKNPSKWLPFNLLANSPYELDLSSSQRRDNWAASYPDPNTAFNSTIDRSFDPSYGGGQRGLNDDAPYSPTDLEKVLRGLDADSGTLPSRLWDVASEFDPVKLMNYDPNRVQLVATAAFGANPSPAAVLAAAQEIADISRHLVTTDSYSLPVANQTMPGYVSEFGADGAPGRRNDSAHQTLNYPGSDDFQQITGVNRAQAKITDLLYYRAWLEARKFVMRTQGLTEANLDALSWTDYQTFLVYVKTRTDLVFPRLGDLLAPEVLAGKRMDLNRPFGDGKDNNGDGVVDDPLEAGEPFLDINGNGVRDDGSNGTPVEPFIDLNGDKIYQGPGDHMWSELGPVANGGNGTLAEPIGFDYTNGHAEPVHAAVAKALNQTIRGGVRNLESQGRQLFARHLYCLMLLLVDDGYIAPWDENDPQLLTYMDSERKKLTGATNPTLSAAEADLIVKRKLTCKMIAQWAVNCVDMRDSDAIMTPFEYTENPWFGWGVWDDKWIGDPKASFVKVVGDPTTATFIPLDGDPATDESNAWVIDWASIPATGGPKVIKQIGINPNQPVSTTNLAIITHPLNQTRGVVWGAERPELLITETLAYHERRAEDLESNDSNGHGLMTNYKQPGEMRYQDPDPDQGLRPRGSLFVEVYNPWSLQGQYPAEVYSRLDSTTNYLPQVVPGQQGVDLGRLSNFAWDETKGRLTLDKSDAANGIKRSPVWRLAVVEEWPDSRNDDAIDDKRLDRVIPSTFKEPQAYIDMATKVKNWKPTAAEPNPPFRPTDLDFDAAFDSSFLPTQQGAGKNLFQVQYPYLEHEFYFTTDKSPIFQPTTGTDLQPDYDYSPTKFKLRIPYRAIITTDPNPPVKAARQPRPAQSQKFIPFGLELSSKGPVIAPIMPGRYGVIGSAGANYNLTSIDPKGAEDPNKQVYISTIGRNKAGDPKIWNTDDKDHYPLATRRVEMHPNSDPNVPQIVIGSNGGDPKDEFHPAYSDAAGNPVFQYDPTTSEIGRDNELINDHGTVKNIMDSNATDGKPTGTPNARYYQPCVAIPVEGMNISEPPWGYAASEYEAAVFESQKKNPPVSPTLFAFYKDPLLSDKNFEGRYHDAGGNKTSYDKPFDGYPDKPTAPELLRNGTTANYRTIHLQRLANPMLPWNPLPGQVKYKDASGTVVDMYRANMPVNPYRTVDSSSVDLTAFNGVSDAEANYQGPDETDGQRKLLQGRPWVEGSQPELQDYLNAFQAGKQVWHFRSTERGGWARLNVVGSNPTAPATITSPPQRVLWTQEPAMVKFKIPGANLFDLITGRQVTMRVSEVPSDIKSSQSQSIVKNRVDMVIEHTLGFGNKSFGLLFDKLGAKQPGTPSAQSMSSSAPPMASGSPIPSAIGAPAAGDYTWDNDSTVDPKTNQNIVIRVPVTSTDPWLAWDNRPYVSAEELLKVPAASQSQMLRQYATIDPNVAAANRPNPYGLAELGSNEIATPMPNSTRWAVMQAPFGHLANVFAVTAMQPLVPGPVQVPWYVQAWPITTAAGVLPKAAQLPWYVQGVADVVRDSNGIPVLFDRKTGTTPPSNPTVADVRPYGAPNLSRILEYVQVPSRFVGTDTMLNAETFNDVPGVNDANNVAGTGIGSDITDASDPRYYFQPPFNKVSRERDPGRVNLNTVTGRRIAPTTGAAQIWSEVFDGIMHRFHDGNMTSQNQLGHFGPAWRDIVLSRRGYVQVDANGIVDKPTPTATPDTFQFGLNNNFPTFFANPFRSPDAGDLVPLVQMLQYGVDASMERVHPRTRGINGTGASATLDPKWGDPAAPVFGDARDAGFGNDLISYRANGAIPNDDVTQRDILPLFSESRGEAFADTDRNPYMMYEPMSRLGNLVTNRSGVYAVWITVGYFEVEKAPDWNDPDPTTQTNVRAHFGGDINLYNRAYPDGYMLGKELGSETGDVKRPRGFYIIDRTEEVGFKPGEDLNVEKTIRLRRRIE